MPDTTSPAEADTASLDELIVRHTPLGMAVCMRMREAAARLGVDLGNTPDWSLTRFELKTDPYSGEVSLIGVWKDGHRYGTINCFPDQRVFAEYQILAPHPELKNQFIEAISVWGKADGLKSEPILQPMPE